MKISFQIIHSFSDDTLKVLSHVYLHTLQDDLYLPTDIATSIEDIQITLERNLDSGEKLCFFTIQIDEDSYDENKYDSLIEGFTTRLKAINGYLRLVKLTDEFRVKIYLSYFNEIAEIEMKIREVFSYIFYNRYTHEEVDELNEYTVKYPAEKPKKEDFIERMENPFFYFTFNGYKDYFLEPRDIPFDIKDFKDLIFKIKTSIDLEKLKEVLEVKGIIIPKHIDFILGIKEDLTSIEKLRNCVAHNRNTSQKTISSYAKSKEKLLQQIQEFWNSEYEEINASLEVNFAELYSYDCLNDLLSRALWDESQGIVFIQDLRIHEAHEAHEFSNINDLNAYLVEIANDEAESNFPSNTDDREVYESLYKGQSLVNKVLNQYKKELIIMGWI